MLLGHVETVHPGSWMALGANHTVWDERPAGSSDEGRAWRLWTLPVAMQDRKWVQPMPMLRCPDWLLKGSVSAERPAGSGAVRRRRGGPGQRWGARRAGSAAPVALFPGCPAAGEALTATPSHARCLTLCGGCKGGAQRGCGRGWAECCAVC